MALLLLQSFIATLLLLWVTGTKTVSADTVVANKACFSSNENFVITFTTTNPRFGDTIQIVRAGTTNRVLSIKTCTGTICRSQTPSSGQVTFVQSLAARNYQAVYRRTNNGAITATSTTFRLVGSGQSCTTTIPPTRAPTSKPVVAALAPPTSLNAIQAVAQARAAIESLVRADPRLTPEFIRMGFHDCIHICDGCIDLTDSNNNGLARPIQKLEPIVAQFEDHSINFTRADIWALAAMVGADVAPHGSTTVTPTFPMKWFGRVNCEDANPVCTNKLGAVVPCSPIVGPARVMPSTNFDGPSLFSYFSTEFSLTQRQVMALMGAHTVGHLLKNESGITGDNGWDVNNNVLQNEYYNALIGAFPAAGKDPITLRDVDSPSWTRTVDTNPGGNVNRWALSGFTPVPLVMLNPDVALVRDLNPSNTNPTTGLVNCAFNSNVEPGTPACGLSSTFSIAIEFNDDNDIWLSEFSSAMDFMLTNGYNRNACGSSLCFITPI